MMVRRLFFSFVREKRWLEQMNNDGWELMSASPLRYELEQTGTKVAYEYVCLKKGRKSYREFDYKSRDSSARAVYANSEMALFKKPVDKGAFTLFASAAEKKRNYAERRTSMSTTGICLMGVSVVFASMGRGTGSPFALAASALLILVSVYYLLLSSETERYIKTL